MASNTKGGQTPKLHEVVNVLGANFPLWYVLGVYLKMNDQHLDTIKANERDVRMQFILMVQTWLRKTEKPEWVALYKALKKMDEHALAARVFTQHCCDVTESEKSIEVQTPPSDESLSQGVQPQVESGTPPQHSRTRIQAASITQDLCTAPLPCVTDASVEDLKIWKLSATFSYMFLMVVQLLEKIVNVGDLKFFLEDLHHTVSRQPYVDRNCFERCKSTAEVLRSLSPQYINVTHPYLLQEIVERFGCKQSKALVEEYLTTFNQEARSLSLKRFGDPLSDDDIKACRGVRRIKVVVDGDPDSVTLSEVETCRKVLESTMSVKHAVIVFAKYTTENSVGLIFLVPESLLGIIVDMSKDRQKLKELASCGILRIESEACTIVLTEDTEYWKLRFLKHTYGEQSKEGDADSGFTSMSSSRTSNLCDISVVGDASTKDDQSAYEFAEKLHANTTGATATFDQAIISDVAAAQLADGLSDNHSLKQLTLKRCRICSEGISCLASSLQTNKSLTSLWFSDTELSDEAVDELAKSLNINETLQELLLGGCEVSDRGAASLADCLYSNRSLKTLNLGSNKITDRGATSLIEALSVNNTLTELYLSYNAITDNGALALATSLHTNHSIKILHLTGNNISDRGATSLSEALSVNNTLTELYLDHNAITDNGALALATSLHTNHSIKDLRLSWNKLTDTGVSAIAQAVQVSHTLKTLWLSLTVATDRGAGVLADSLEATSSLKVLVLFGTLYISREVMKRMKDFARRKGITLKLY